VDVTRSGTLTVVLDMVAGVHAALAIRDPGRQEVGTAIGDAGSRVRSTIQARRGTYYVLVHARTWSLDAAGEDAPPARLTTPYHITATVN